MFDCCRYLYEWIRTEWSFCQSGIDGNLCPFAIDPRMIATLCQSYCVELFDDLVCLHLSLWSVAGSKMPLFLLLSRCPHQQPDVRMLSAEAPRRTSPGWDQVLFLPGMSGRVHEAVRSRLPVRRVQLEVSVVPFQQVRRRRHEAQSCGRRLLRLLRVQVVYVFLVPTSEVSCFDLNLGDLVLCVQQKITQYIVCNNCIAVTLNTHIFFRT